MKLKGDIRMSCSCCKVHVAPPAKRGQYARITYNGEASMGWDAIGKRVGLNGVLARKRATGGICFFLTTTEALRVSHRGGREKPTGVPNKDVAAKFNGLVWPLAGNK